MARFNIPVITRSLLILIIGLTSLNVLVYNNTFRLFLFFGRISPLLGYVPGTSWIYPWTFITATYVEQNLAGLLTTCAAVLFGGRYLERAWGMTEFGKFVLVISAIPNIILVLLYFIIPAAPIDGGIAIQAGFLVAFKQLVPEHTVSLLRGILRLRVKHFPAIFLAANIISGISLRTENAMFLSWFGFLTSWVYLRFFRVSPLLTTSTGDDAPTIRGDASDTFAFAYFFPDMLQGPISAITNPIYGLFISLRILRPWSSDDIDAGNEAALARSDSGLPTTRGASGRREEAERRRALALKALDQRLHAATAGNKSSPGVTVTIPAPVIPPETEEVKQVA